MRPLLCLFLLGPLLLFAQPDASTYRFDVRDFGARGVLTDTATQAIQAAIDAAHAAGGGQVYFPPGDYVAGTLVLKSQVTLFLEGGAVLRASRNPKDFETDFIVYKKNDSGKAGDGATPVFIYAKAAENIAILGTGTIDGQATRTYEPLKQVDGFIEAETENAREAGVEMKMYYKVRPFTCLLFFESCTNVRLRDVTLRESTDWTLHFKWCERVYVDNVYLYSSLDAGVNADGIDVDGCRDVAITNCVITTGDDAIVLKSTNTDGEFYPCENVAVTNCVLQSTSTGLKLGTESFGDFRHITFANCVITNSNRGLSIVVRDGATVEQVLFSDITIHTDRKHFNWWGNGDPIWLVVKKRFPDSKLGRIRDVVFDNVVATGQGTSKLEGFAPTKAHPAGSYLENIQLRNVQLRMEAEDKSDKRADHAFAGHHVRGLRVTGLRVRWDRDPAEPAWRSAVHLRQVEDLLGESWDVAPASPVYPAVQLENVRRAYLDRLLPAAGTETAVSVSGAESDRLTFTRLDPLGVAATKVKRGAGVAKKGVWVE